MLPVFNRKIDAYLKDWRQKSNRKPLIIRGARQVGKSTLVRKFGDQFEEFVLINLERKNYRDVFDRIDDLKRILDALRLQTGKSIKEGKTLLFIDEIQESPTAIQSLRFFYEDFPDLHVIAAGSLLEFALGDVGSFPVGRVEQVVMHPFDFEEYLNAQGRSDLIEAMQKIPFDNIAYTPLMEQYRTFVAIGSMPEVVQTFVTEKDTSSLPGIYANIWQSYTDDVEKYAQNLKERNLIRYLIHSALTFLDRINFAKIGKNQYSGRAVGEAFRTIDLTRLFRLIYPTTRTESPIVPAIERQPRLQMLDTGLLLNSLGLQHEVLLLDNLESTHSGKIVQHMVIQEYQAQFYLPNQKPTFWVRENANSNAEVDLLIQQGSQLIPVEVKSGKSGRLRSLQEFVDRCPHDRAIRCLQNQFSMEQAYTRKGKAYELLNLPLFLAGQLPAYAKWWANK